MNTPSERAPETSPSMIEGFEPQLALPRDELDALHRAINERRAQQENPELLRHLRSL